MHMAQSSITPEADKELSGGTHSESLSLLYAENAKVAATFWDWRHKVMERFFAALAGLIVGAAWIYNQRELRRLFFIPLLIGSVYSLVSYLMDRVNRNILFGCYETGKQIEERLGPVPGAYSRILDNYKRVNYTVFLRMMYLSTSVLLLIGAALAALLVK